eukprot:6209922-Pleurochrysis_carterae.AAC.1
MPGITPRPPAPLPASTPPLNNTGSWGEYGGMEGAFGPRRERGRKMSFPFWCTFPDADPIRRGRRDGSSLRPGHVTLLRTASARRLPERASSKRQTIVPAGARKG